jgi:hypothetical protein
MMMNHPCHRPVLNILGIFCPERCRIAVQPCRETRCTTNLGYSMEKSAILLFFIRSLKLYFYLSLDDSRRVLHHFFLSNIYTSIQAAGLSCHCERWQDGNIKAKSADSFVPARCPLRGWYMNYHEDIMIK